MIPTLNRSVRKQLPYVGCLLAFAFAFAVLVAPSTALADGPAQNTDTAKFEMDFMQMMIDHHNMAVGMSRMCLQKATHNELRSMCQNIIDSQSQEIQEMQSWLASWYKIDKQPQMMPDGQQTMSQFNASTGGEFEKMFLQMMIEHHSKAIQDATPCVQRAAHEQLKSLCQNIISSQSQEIKQMQIWLSQWYGVSNTTSVPAQPTNTALAQLPQTGGSLNLDLFPLALGTLFLGAGLFLLRLKRNV